MKKIHRLRLLSLLFAVFIAGVAVNGEVPTWLKILSLAVIGGNLLLMEEFQHDYRSRASGR